MRAIILTDGQYTFMSGVALPVTVEAKPEGRGIILTVASEELLRVGAEYPSVTCQARWNFRLGSEAIFVDNP